MIWRLHLIVGLSGVALFLLSGRHFLHGPDGLQGVDDTPRLLLRTSHIYFFMASLVSVVLGLYYRPKTPLPLAIVLNQFLVIASPFLLAYGFVFEAHDNLGIEQPVSALGIIVLFVWLVNNLLGRLVQWYKRRS